MASWKKAVADYRVARTAYESCVIGGAAGCAEPAVPGLPANARAVPVPAGPGGGPAPPPAPTLSPAEAGIIAVARLQLPINTPGIGPDPDVNRWKMAAVGYPLWLWSDGATQLGPVGQDVAGLSVSLRARVARTVFRMGDGQSVRCTGAGTPYRDSITPGTKSPSCGYAYTKPSLPRGKYTVTAVTYWAVTWTVNGQSGVIDVPRVGSAQLPVGELQSLVR